MSLFSLKRASFRSMLVLLTYTHYVLFQYIPFIAYAIFTPLSTYQRIFTALSPAIFRFLGNFRPFVQDADPLPLPPKPVPYRAVKIPCLFVCNPSHNTFPAGRRFASKIIDSRPRSCYTEKKNLFAAYNMCKSVSGCRGVGKVINPTMGKTAPFRSQQPS